MLQAEIIESLCFTGHRDLNNFEICTIEKHLNTLLPFLIEKRGLINCYAGGALGLDTVAAKTVIKLKSKYTHLNLNLILPCHGQDRSWNIEQKATYTEIMESADNVRILAPFYYNGCMQARNRELLKNSDLCVAYLRRGTSKGGSLNTVLQATKSGIQVINLADFESEDIL